MFEAILLSRPRRYQGRLSNEDRMDLDRLIYFLELDPWIDGVFKTPLAVSGGSLTLFEDKRWRVAYQVVDDAFVLVYAISKVAEP